MDLTPDNNYHPEDEYEELVFASVLPEQQETPASPDQTAEVTSAPEPVQDDAVESAPAPEQPTAAQPQYPAAAPFPYYPAYPQPIYYAPPMQPQYPPQMMPPVPYPAQQGWHPAPYGFPPAGYPPFMPVYPQSTPPMQPPVQQPAPAHPAPSDEDTDTEPLPDDRSVPKQPASTGTKVFIIILIALLVSMTLGFCIYIAKLPAPESSDDGSAGASGYPGTNDSASPIDNYIDYNGGFTEVEDEVTLVEDNGETQDKEYDNPDSVGTPDESAKGIKLEKQPSDKDSGKYTAQTAYDSVCDSVVTVICYRNEITNNAADMVSQGTGTVFSSDGYLITNAHVIGNCKAYAVKIIFNNGDSYPAKIIGYDTWSDLAVLKIDAKSLKAVTFGDSKLIAVGDDVITVGSPGGEQFKNSLTKGVISAVDRELSVNKFVRYIQCDAAISPGNSGGPLCNIYGQVIGITTAKTVAENYENMSFSIPSSTVEEIANDLIHYGYVKGRSRIGIAGYAITAEEAYYYNFPVGIFIEHIDETSALADADVKEGDVITELDGKKITSFQDIYDVLADHKAGDKVSIKVQRPTN